MELIVQVEAIVGYLRSCLQGTWRTWRKLIDRWENII
jgi:hypothetical protein